MSRLPAKSGWSNPTQFSILSAREYTKNCFTEVGFHMNYSLLNSAVKTLSSPNHFIPLLVYSKDEKPAFVTVHFNLTRYPEIWILMSIPSANLVEFLMPILDIWAAQSATPGTLLLNHLKMVNLYTKRFYVLLVFSSFHLLNQLLFGDKHTIVEEESLIHLCGILVILL